MPVSHLIDLLRTATVTPGFLSNLISGVLLALFALVLKVFNPRPRVRWGLSHQFYFAMPGMNNGPALPVMTRSVFVMNAGSGPAEELEVHLNFAPSHFEIWPNFKYSTTTTPGPVAHLVVEIPNLAPREQFTIEMIQVGGAMPDVLRVRHKAKEAKQVPLQFHQEFSRWVNALIAIAFIAGCFWLCRICVWLVFYLAGVR
jgi:hypothetical protein